MREGDQNWEPVRIMDPRWKKDLYYMKSLGKRKETQATEASRVRQEAGGVRKQGIDGQGKTRIGMGGKSGGVRQRFPGQRDWGHHDKPEEWRRSQQWGTDRTGTGTNWR